MKLFVTGVCGRLGRAIAQVAAGQGMDVVGIDIVPWPDDVEQPAHRPTGACRATFPEGVYCYASNSDTPAR